MVLKDSDSPQGDIVPPTTPTKLSEILEKVSGWGYDKAMNACKQTDEEMYAEATQAILKLISEARVDELKNLPLEVHEKHAYRTNMCISIRARNARIKQLTEPEKKHG